MKLGAEAIFENISVTHLIFLPFLPPPTRAIPAQPQREEGVLGSTLESSPSETCSASGPGAGPALAAIWLTFS